MRSMAAWSSGSVRSITEGILSNEKLYSRSAPPNMTTPGINEQLTTLFALGREVASVLDLDELLHKIPQLIARLTKFQAFAVYLLDPKRDELTIAYSVGYPEEVAQNLRVQVG